MSDIIDYCKLWQTKLSILHNMRNILLLTLFAGFSLLSFGQNQKSDGTLSRLAKLSLGFEGLGFTYEPKLFNKLTLDVSAGAGGGYDIGESSLLYDLKLTKPAFYFSMTPKYFYNREARFRKGKNTVLNSGNYIGLRLKYVTPNDRQSDSTRNSILTNIHWGIQRAIGNHFTINTHLGAGYAQDIDYNFGTIYPAIDFKISYIISNSKK